MANVKHSKGWSLTSDKTPLSKNDSRSDSAHQNKETIPYAKGQFSKERSERNPNGTTNRPVRRTILQRFNLRSGIKSGRGKKEEEGSRVCGSTVKFTLNTNPHDNMAAYNASVQAKEKKKLKASHKKQIKEKEEPKIEPVENNGPELNSVVTVYHHKNSSCYEISTYDVNAKAELNRLYVPAEEVADLTEQKKNRLSFMSGRGSFLGGRKAEEKKLSAKFSDLMAFTLDSDKKPCVDILRPDPDNPRRKSTIAFPKPDSVSPSTLIEPNIKADGTLGPIGKRATILRTIGRKLSIFGGKSSPQVVPAKPATVPLFDSIAENESKEENDSAKTPAPSMSAVPKQISSTNLTSNFKYDKGVDQMLSEAAQMREDLAARRAAEGDGDSGKRFGRKKNR